MTELPQAPDAERIVLGSMVTDPAVIPTVVERLPSEAFSSPANLLVFQHITMAYGAGEPVEPVALTDRLIRSGDINRLPAGGTYLHDLVSAVPTSAQVGFYIDMVRDAADRRSLLAESAALAQIAAIPDAEQRGLRVAKLRERLVEGVVVPRKAPLAVPLDWSSFLTREVGPVDFLAGRLMVRSQHVTLIGEGKAGKSLFALEWLWRMSAGLPFLGDEARPPVRVLYVDQENTDDDIQERLESLGATAGTLGNLIYLSFPMFRPLNTAAGAADLLAVVDEYRPTVVALDTISRMVDGKENDSDPWLALYRWTLLPLKARKVSSIRLDHFGKDVTRGGRGNSAKTQDVDAVWELLPTERGSSLLRLVRTHTRNGKGHDDLLLRRHGELVGDRWKPGGTWHGIADEDERPSSEPDPTKQYRPAARRVLGVLATAQQPLTVQQIGDILAGESSGPLKPRTIQDALRTLADASEVDETAAGSGKASVWTVPA